MTEKKKELSWANLLLTIGIAASGWIAVSLIRSFTSVPASIAGCVFQAAVTLGLVMLPILYFIKKDNSKDSIRSVFFSSLPKGSYVCLGGSISAGALALCLLFPAIPSIHPISVSTAVLYILQASLYYGIVWGAYDEIFFRGYLLQILNEYFEKWIALTATTAVYVLAELFLYYHGQFNFLLVISTILQGLMLGCLTLNTKSVWTAAATHALMNAVFHQQFIVISASSNSNALIHYQLTSAGDIITGGAYGMQGTITVLIGYALVLLYVIFKDAVEVLPAEEENGEKKLVAQPEARKEDKKEKKSQNEKPSPSNVMSTVMLRLEKQSQIHEGVVPPPLPSENVSQKEPEPVSTEQIHLAHDAHEKNQQLLKLNTEIEENMEKVQAIEKDISVSESAEKKAPSTLPPIKDTAPEHTEKIKPIEIKGFTGKQEKTGMNIPPIPNYSENTVSDSLKNHEVHLPPLPEIADGSISVDKMPPLPGDSSTSVSSRHSMTPQEVETARKAAYEKYKSHQ